LFLGLDAVVPTSKNSGPIFGIPETNCGWCDNSIFVTTQSTPKPQMELLLLVTSYSWCHCLKFDAAGKFLSLSKSYCSGGVCNCSISEGLSLWSRFDWCFVDVGNTSNTNCGWRHNSIFAMSQMLFLGPDAVALLGPKVCCRQNHGPITDVHDTNWGWSDNSLSLFHALLTSLQPLLPFLLAFVVLLFECRGC
jgi:hypothetical protein